MQSRFLFPHSFKKFGWFIALPAFVLGLLKLFTGLELSFLEFKFKEADFIEGKSHNFTNELIGVLLIIGLNLIAFSKEKTEDEWIAKIRLESLQWGVYINSLVMVICILFLYGFDFLNVMAFNLFTVLIFFTIRFHYIIYIKPLLEKKSKVNAF